MAVNRQRATFATNSGSLLLQKNQITDAIERYQEAVSSDPTYIEAHRGLATALARAGRTAEAEAERQKACNLTKLNLDSTARSRHRLPAHRTPSKFQAKNPKRFFAPANFSLMQLPNELFDSLSKDGVPDGI